MRGFEEAVALPLLQVLVALPIDPDLQLLGLSIGTNLDDPIPWFVLDLEWLLRKILEPLVLKLFLLTVDGHDSVAQPQLEPQLKRLFSAYKPVVGNLATVLANGLKFVRTVECLRLNRLSQSDRSSRNLNFTGSLAIRTNDTEGVQ